MVIVLRDLDDKCLTKFRQELDSVLSDCNPAPVISFCIAIEEEAWLLGDIPAISFAHPNAKGLRKNNLTFSVQAPTVFCHI